MELNSLKTDSKVAGSAADGAGTYTAQAGGHHHNWGVYVDLQLGKIHGYREIREGKRAVALEVYGIA